MADRPRILPVQPTGTTRSAAFIDYADGHGEAGIYERPTYPPSPRGEQLRRMRVDRGLSLGATARRLGIRASELSGLELGRLTMSDAEWDVVAATVGMMEGGTGG